MSTDSFVIGENLIFYLEGEKTIFLKCDPSPVDFMTTADATYISIVTKKVSLKVPVKEQFDSLMGLISLTVFSKDKTVIAWDIKPLLTYIKNQGNAGTFADLDTSRVYDLKLAEAFCGLQNQPPATWAEAVARLKTCMQNDAAWRMHRNIHLPLALRVIPAIETCGVVDIARQKSFYPSYTIEGQVQGRMKCNEAFPRCINPHSLDEGLKSVIVPKAPHDLLVQLDYRAMEVRVLQWLSKDPVLGEIINDSTKDVYEEIYKIITESKEAGPKERSLAKTFFLPVFFGQQAFKLAENLGTSKEMAQAIIDLIATKFHVAWDWTDKQHQTAKDTGKVTDYFGRVRVVESPYVARHFSIASPAATICLDKLIKLHDALPKTARIAFSIHDGYIVATNRTSYKEVVATCKNSLEAEEELYKGLFLKTSCEIGKSLGKMLKMF
jgi:hypothetical protein